MGCMGDEVVYLTKEIKEYYMNDFTKNVVNCSDKYWGLDKGLLKICTDINKNNNVQTVYSRRYSGGKYRQNSYLWILISESVLEETIDKFYYDCKTKLKSIGIECYEPPEPIINNREDITNLCLTDPNYLQHGFISITLYSNKLKDHKFFWEKIHEHLINW